MNKTQIKFKSYLVTARLFGLLLFISGCASIYIPKKQSVHIHHPSDDAVVVLDGDTIGYGNHVKKRIKKEGSRQITVKVPGEKESQHVLLPTHRPVFFWLMQPLNISCFFIYGYMVDFSLEKNVSYNRHYYFPYNSEGKQRDSLLHNYVRLENVQLLKSKGPSSFLSVFVKYSKNKDMLEKRKNKAEQKAILAEKDRDKYSPNMIYTGPFNIPHFEEKVVGKMNELLDQFGYYNREDSIFFDSRKYTYLSCRIDGGVVYQISGKANNQYEELKLNCTWFVTNKYGEKVDSISITSKSGQFIFGNLSLMYDALGENFMQLVQNPFFTKYIQHKPQALPEGEKVQLGKITKPITKQEDVPKACVAVRTSLGHGSGFAISHEGHIITNYHVISGDVIGNYPKIKIVDYEGLQYDAEIICIDRENDLALLKTGKKFEYCFAIPDSVEIKPLEKIYTIGSPMSTELANSVSKGLVSGTNLASSQGLIQLNMGVSPGNSGGPVFNDNLQLRGIVVSRMTNQEVEEICFAVPANKIKRLLSSAE
ncbi:MAG: trypsin-like serine protease [Bacteroidetes bacterium]|nr:trypsin-like serine protease [Bacteroidota bacterium]